VEDLKQKMTAYQKAFVFTTKLDLEDSFDYDGMMKAQDIHNELTREMFETFGKTNPVYGAGGCTICEKCAYPEPCRFPDKAYASVEAVGIDVSALSRSAQVKYNNGPNTITYFSMILFNE
jgi:predicted metal-binding protein